MAWTCPTSAHFPVHFVEHYEESRYPAEDVDSNASPIVFPWSKMQEVLDNVSGTWATEDYVKADGRPISKVLGGSAERIDAGTSSKCIRETSSSVYHVVSGHGYSIIGDDKVSWKEGDTFCIPAWYRFQHFASDEMRVYLYRFHDKPMLSSLGFYRAEGTDVEALVSD